MPCLKKDTTTVSLPMRTIVAVAYVNEEGKLTQTVFDDDELAADDLTDDLDEKQIDYVVSKVEVF